MSTWMRALGALAPGGEQQGLAARALDPRRWLLPGADEKPFETILGLPRLADMPALDRQMLALMGGWLLVVQRNGEVNAQVLRAWGQANMEFLQALQASVSGDRPPASLREVLDQWAAAANLALMKAQRSEDFLGAQRGLLDALLSSRTREREVVEAISRMLDLPTRTELDDLHKTVHALKRELRALKRGDRPAAAKPVPRAAKAGPAATKAAPRAAARRAGRAPASPAQETSS